MDVFRFAELVESFFAKLPGMARLPHSAEWTGIVVGEWIVNPERTGSDVVHRLHRPFHVVCVDIRAKTVGRIICHPDRFIDVAHAHDRKNRTERLCAHDPHILADIDHYRRLVEEAFFKLLGTPSASKTTSAFANGF